MSIVFSIDEEAESRDKRTHPEQRTIGKGPVARRKTYFD